MSMDRTPARPARTLAALALALSACAPAVRDPWATAEEAQARARAQADPGAICQVRVENRSDFTLEAGYRAGSIRMSLGMLKLDDTVEFGVPCRHETVTVFVIREITSSRQRVWVDPKTAELDPLEIIAVKLDYRPIREDEASTTREEDEA